jgi:hypothetical protein
LKLPKKGNEPALAFKALIRDNEAEFEREREALNHIQRNPHENVVKP